MLTKYLGHFGAAAHIHSRHPPDKLTHPGSAPVGQYGTGSISETYAEWFSSVEIPDRDLASCKVIFIYKNPIKAIYSRFGTWQHLRHIGCKNFSASHEKLYDITLEDVVESREDLYGIEEFFENYTTPNPRRNYKICCIRYEDFFENVEDFNLALGLPTNPNLFPRKRETSRNQPFKQELEEIYSDLISKMNELPPIHFC